MTLNWWPSVLGWSYEYSLHPQRWELAGQLWNLPGCVSRAKWMEMSWKLIWVRELSLSSITNRITSTGDIPSDTTSLSSTIKMNNFDKQQWLQLNFLSQLKHSPFSQLMAISSRDKSLKGTDGFGGVGKNGGGGSNGGVGLRMVWEGRGTKELWGNGRGRE